MKHYPWLKQKYKDIIHRYQINQLHPIILIQSCLGMGVSRLIFNICKWILCFHKKKYKNCRNCLSCLLIKQNNHPDLYHFKNFSKNKNIGIQTIRNIINNINHTAQQGGKKIVWFSEMNQLTQESNNALLKTLEEPPYNTIFFLKTNNITTVNHTITSRSTIYYIDTPNEDNILSWLKKKNHFYSSTQLLTVLRINNHAPIAANKFLKNNLFHERNEFMKSIYSYVNTKKNIPFLNNKYYFNEKKIITWICYLLIDVMKYKISKKNKIKNLDQIPLIKKIAHINSINKLNDHVISWIKYKQILSNSFNIDKKLIFTEQMLSLVNILKK